MWELAAQDESKQHRVELLEAQRHRLRSLSSSTPLDLALRDFRGLELLEEINLADLGITSDWFAVLAAHAAALGGSKAAKCKRLILAGTGIADMGVTHVSKFKSLVFLDVSRRVGAHTLSVPAIHDSDTVAHRYHHRHYVSTISRCFLLTDDSLTTIRRQLNLLEELHINECRHFTSPVLTQLWKDCKRLHSLSACGCPAVTDAFLQCVATTKRSSPEFTLKRLDIRHCKQVSSSGISYLATSSLKDLAVVSLSVGDCLEVDSMAFFGFETSAGFRKVKELNLCGLQIDETAVSWIVKGCQTHLQRLNLSWCKTLTDFALLLLTPLIRPGSLTYLNLNECPLLTDAGIRNLFSAAEEEANRFEKCDEDDDEAAGATSLTTLNLKNCTQIGDESMRIVSKYCPKLVKLNLKGLRKLSDQGVMHIGKGCPRIASFKISGRYISTQSFQLLGKLFHRLEALDISERTDLETPLCIMHFTTIPRTAATQQSLKQINLSATNVCDVGVSMIAVSCRQLEWLNLSKVRSVYFSLYLLAHAPSVTGLLVLSFEQCFKLTDISIEALASCSFKLSVLLLSNVKAITDKSLLACAETKLPLRIVDFGSNTNITDAGVLALCSSCQEIQELRLKGCDRVSLKTIKQCSDMLLPFTKPLVPPTLSQKIATGGASAMMMLTSLPIRHVDLLRLMALHYEKALVLQAKFRRRKQKEASLLFLSRRKLVRESRAAKKIQTCIHRFLSWRRYLHLLSLEKSVSKIIFVQAHARGNACRRQVRVLKFVYDQSACVIQRHCRPHIREQLWVRNGNALEIQRVYRGFLGRRICKQVTFERRLAAGNKIWQWYRRCKHRRDFHRRSLWLMQKIRSIQGQWRKYKRRCNFTTHLSYYRKRATLIQSVWRRATARKYVQKKRVKMHAAALDIQRMYRGFRVRVFVKMYRPLATWKATLIQSHWRRFQKRTWYRQYRKYLIKMQRMARYAHKVRLLRHIARKALEKHRNEAAITIQRHVRGWRGRKRALLYRKIRNAKYARRGQNARHAMIRRTLIQRGAAILIQTWIRRVQARRRMLKIRKWRRFVAAKCIQRYLREWIRVLRSKQKREAKTHAAINIQRAFRGYRGRVYFKAEKYRQQCLKSAKLIQRIYRGHHGRTLFKQVRKEKMSAALLLQRAYRSKHARKIYEISQAMAALKAKDKYEHSIRGWIDAKRNPMDELYRRAKLPREKAVLVALKDKWEANKVAEERAVRKFKREYNGVWETANETIGNYYAVRRKLYGVTENVYASNREFIERQERQKKLKTELVDLHTRVEKFKAAIQEASARRRMLDGEEVFEILKAHGLFLEHVPASNQDDVD